MAVKSFAAWSSEKKKKQVQQGEVVFDPAVAKAEPIQNKPLSFTEWSTQKKASTLVNEDYINAFITDVGNYLNNAKSDYDSIGWKNASSAFESRRASTNDLDQRAKYIGSWLRQNQANIDPNAAKGIVDILKAYQTSAPSVLESFKGAADYYGQFETEDAYKAHVKARDEYNKKVAPFASAKDDYLFGYYSNLGASFENPTYEQVENGIQIFGWRSGKDEDVQNIVTYSRDNADKIGLGEGEGHDMFGDYLYSFMTDDEVAIYNYYLAKHGKKEAQAYLDAIYGYLKDRHEGKIIQNVSEFANDAPVLGSAVSVFTSLGSGAEYITDLFNYAVGRDETLDTNLSADVTNIIRGTVSEQASFEIAGWDAGAFLYNTGMSMADSLTAGLTFGGAGGAVLGLSAAAQGTNDALNRGMSDEKAFWNGLFSGVFEGLFESVSIGKFNALKEVTPITIKDIARNIGKSMLVNASEESLTEIANIAYDTIVNGEFANYTWEDLNNGAWKDALLQVVEAGASGALMGAGMGGVGSAMGYANGSKIAKSIYGGSEAELIAEGLESPEGSYNRALAEKYQIKVDSGKSLTGGQLNRLAQANEQAFRTEDFEAIQSAAESRLTELGEKGNVSEVAAILAKQASGEKLTRAEKKALESSTYGGRVANELNTENIGSGEYSNAWAQKIGTQRINADEYSRLVQAAEMPSEEQNTAAEELPTEAISPAGAQAVEAVEAPAATADEMEAAAASAPVVASENATTEKSSEVHEETAPEKKTLSLDEASKKYGAQAGAMLHTYTEGQDVESYDRAYSAAYDMGKSGVSLSYAMESESTAYLTEGQRELAYEAGKAASESSAREQDAANKAKANGKTGHRKGTVKGEGVKIADLKETFNDSQGKAFKYLSTVAEVTGIDIVLYKSEAGEGGTYEGAQGKFKWSEDTIYIDVNAGLYYAKDADKVAKYAMLRTFSHEFTHFIEKWNPVWYNEFRKTVFDTLAEQGENVHELIEEKQSQSEGLTYDQASRELVAESMTDILPDANFVRELAEKHQNIFQKLLEQFKEFVENLRAYFNGLVRNPSREANALKEQVGETVRYMESIINLFDRVAVEAIETYQATVAQEKVANSQRTSLLTESEEAALLIYKSGGSYLLNAKLREDVALDEHEEAIVRSLDSALEKLPTYRGRVYRNIIFDGFGDKKARDAFVTSHVVGEIVPYFAYTSSSTAVDGYSLEGNFVVHIEIESTNGRNMEGYGNNFESEVLFPRESKFITNNVIYAADGTPTIYLTEATNEHQENKPRPADGRETERNVSRDHTGESRSRTHSAEESNVQRLHVSDSGNGEVQSAVSARNTERDYIQSGDLQGVQAEVETTIPSPASEMQTPTQAVPKLEEKPSGFETAFWNASQAERDEVVQAINENINISHMMPTEIRGEKPSDITQEVNKNVETENADHREAVQQPVPDGQGTAPVLDESQTPDVSGDAQRGDSVADSGERGQQAPQSGSRSGERTETVGGSSEGNSESADLRRDDELTDSATDTNVGHTASEELHEEIVEQIVRQSTEQPKGRNFVIGDSLNLPSGEKARYKANVEAIRLVKRLEAEGRYATEAEQVILSKYVGWGGLANAFDQRKSEWTKEYSEMKELLTKEEFESARGSTLNAHYTDISVIKAMYDGLAFLGFNGGRLLEPSSGVGNFVGAMPAEMSAKVKSWTMVELDGITGLIAKYLYPNADVRIQGFEKANIPDNYMDVAISNVPFGNYAISDKAYPKKVTSAIHNYFFAKSIDKVRPGGIVMFITSSYTMNAQDTTVRRYIMGKADLLGAIRLPSNAFKENAGTEVVTDILILKKREAGKLYAGEDFLESPWGYPVKGNYSGAYVNNYFINHPEMVLGTPSMEGGMYRGNSLTYKAFEDRGSLGDQIRLAFTRIAGKMDYPAKQSPERTNFSNERAGKKTKQDGYVVKEGKVYQNKDGTLVEQNLSKGVVDRIAGLLSIRDAAKDLMNAQQQGQKDTEIKKARTKLNKLYDAFVEKNGYINAPANRNAIKEDPDCYSLYALENWNPDTKKAVKADLFSKNTIAPNRTVTSAKDVAEGLIVSVNQTGGVDVDLIAKLVGKDAEAVTRELIDSRKAFKNRDGALESAEVYLSGNVRAKLRDAEALVPMDADYQKNVDALKAVMPEDIGYQDIFVNPGTPWIPSSVYSDFAAYMLGSSNHGWRPAVDVSRNADTGNFTVELKDARLKFNASNTQKWGTSRRSFLELFDAMLNSKSVVIKREGPDGKAVVDKDATDAANEKIENITKEFQDWLWKDEARRGELATLYNEVFNSIVTPKYNGDNLTVNGANALKPLRAHQRDAVQRVISSGGNTLLAHKVGAGKTYEMAAAAMKLKELGLVKKPMFAVPKSLVAQWGVEFKDFFPTAKLLVAESSDFTASNRKVFMNRIASGDYDAVIVSYEQFEKLPVSDDFTRELYQEQIDSVIAAIEEAKAEKGAKSLSIKDLEKKRKSLQTKIDKLTDKAKDEGNIDFEALGVDSLFIDEAHNFKNLFYTTSMTNVAGLGNKDGSKRAFDLYTKVRYLQKLNGGRGIVFATATPVMNSMSEMYIMQKYLQPDLLNQLGLSTFDAWAKQFGEVVNGVEIKPSGQGYRVKQSFSRFKNMSELQLLFRNFADVLTDIPGLKIPKMKGGKVNVVVCEPGEYQQNYMKELEQRADGVKNVDPSVDNMLKITSDGRKISYTQRMIDPSLPYEEGCKIYRCADNVVERYRGSKSIKGTQLIFCDMATPKGKSQTAAAETEEVETDMESARLYDDIRQRLIEGGIPSKEIAFIHDADTDQKKKKLFADVNDGKVRVLIGSTGKMGVGMNAQKRVVAIHHLDAPWRPGDVEQRNGRAFRQGNINDEVECFTYVTEGSFDARLWDILERKQNFINQIMNGESVGREAEDTGEVTLSAAEVKALASGSPLIMEQVQLDTDIKKLEGLYRSHMAAVRNARERHVADKGRIAALEGYIADGKADIAARKDTYSEGKFLLKIGKSNISEKKDAGIALMAEATAKAVESGYTTIGSFAGFDLRVVKTHEGIKGLISGKQAYSFNTYPGNTSFMINHLIAKVEGLDDTVKAWEQELASTRADLTEQEKLMNEPFAKEAELNRKRLRYKEVMEILNPKEEQTIVEDAAQEQSREYLDEGAEQDQQRRPSLTDREVLAMAVDEVQVDGLNPAEQDALSIFKQRLHKLDTLQEQRVEQGRLYKEQQFGVKVDRAAASETLNRMHVLDEQIKKASADLLSVEEKTVLKQVLQKARKIVENQERQHSQEILARWRDRRNNAAAIKKYRDRLRGDVDDLTNWVLHPNNKDIVKHIPDALKNSVIPFLSSINFMSRRSLSGGSPTVADKEFMNRLNGLKSALRQNADAYGLYSGYNDLPPDFMDRLQTLIDTAQKLVDDNSGEFIINQMTSDELRELSKVVRTLKKFIKSFNLFHANAMYQHVYEAGNDTIQSLDAMKSDGGKSGTVSNFVLWQQMRPAFAFERFGQGGVAIYDGLRRGQAKLAFNTKEIQSFAEKTYTAKEVQAWEKEIKTIDLGGDTVRMPVSTIMSFYELSKRPQALGHILGQGVRVATVKMGKQKISDIGHIITEQDIVTIISTLTDRQKEVADALQKYMAEQGGKWGNYVSVKRFGEELFGEPTYFPIHSDGRHLQANADENPSAASLYALLNMSFTKELTKEANNRIILYSIFDVFANHMASMAQYNAMALPVLDAIKWFNYRQKSEAGNDGEREVIGSVRDQMARVYGTPEETRPGSGKQGYAETFVMNILKAFNGTEAQGVPSDAMGINFNRGYNMAQVAFNLRVVVQQPLAITRAALLVGYDSMLRGLKLSPSAIQKNIAEMQQYSGIAAWKSLGFYDINISRGITETIKHSSTIRDKISEVGMWGAEKADLLTWAAIWSACKEEVIHKQRISPKNEGFYDAVTQLFEDVIYKTQVVDSILTKNEFLRSKGAFARLVGSFMSEPTATANMLVNAYDNYGRDRQRGMSRQGAWQKNCKLIVRTAYVYGVSAILLAAVQATIDALRDDDEYEEYPEKWLEAFWGNFVDELMPFNKLPIVSDFYDLAKELLSIFGVDTYGNPPQSVFMQWYDSLVKGVEIIYDKITGEDNNYTWYGGAYKLLQAVSGMSGLPMASATREIITAWNNTVGTMSPSLKVQIYDPGDKNEIKYAYMDGYLTAEEATDLLIEKGIADTEDEAYWIIEGWNAGEGFSPYDALYEAMRSSASIDSAMDDLTSHGYEEEQVLKQAKNKIGEWYSDGEITKQQAISMLEKYTDLTGDEITATVNRWSCKVVTGIAYGDIDDAFMEGTISADRAKEMYMRYGGMTAEKVAEKVTVLAFVKEYPQFEAGDLTYSMVKDYRTYCETTGIDVKVFYDAWKYKNSLSGSVKEPMMQYINGLPLSARQKDSLYYAFGWAESKISEAPWR